MRQLHLDWLIILFLAPYLVGWAPADSSFDEYSIGIGTGQYASRDCAGIAHSNSFYDVGGKIMHKYEAPFRIGLSASVISDDAKTTVIPYPDIALDLKYFSLGTTGIRIGSENGTYGEISILDQVPLFSGKGAFRMGIGTKTTENVRFWIGFNALPYNARGLAGQIDFPFSTNQFLFINGRYGISWGVPEYGISVGTRIRMYENNN